MRHGRVVDERVGDHGVEFESAGAVDLRDWDLMVLISECQMFFSLMQFG